MRYSPKDASIEFGHGVANHDGAIIAWFIKVFGFEDGVVTSLFVTSSFYVFQ